MKPPVPPQYPYTRTIHNREITDIFAWIEDIDHPQTRLYLDAENDYTNYRVAHQKELRASILEELLSRTSETDQTAPYTVGDWTQFAMIEKHQSYWVYKRKHSSGLIETLLDGNQRAEGHKYFQVDTLKINPAQTYVAWLEDTQGNERFALYVQHLETNNIFSIQKSNIKWTLAWLDSKNLVYICGDDADRPCSVYLYNLDTGHSTLIWHESDEHFHLTVNRARIGNIVVCEAHSKTTSDVRLLETDGVSWKLTHIRPRQHGIKYTVAVGPKQLYIRSNQTKREFSISTQARNDHQIQHHFWTPPAGVTIQDLDLFSSHLVCWIRDNGLLKLYVHNLQSGTQSRLNFPDPTYEIYPDINHHFDTTQFRLRYTSPIQPDIVLSYCLETGISSCIHRFNTPNFIPSQYKCDRLWGTSQDGTQVPISIVESVDHQSHSPSPLLLVGYGAYGVSYDVGFQSHWISLVDRGFRIAIAHVRGGGEMGRHWYNQGKGIHKQNSFNDFITCSEYLLDNHYTTSDRLIISGGSAGGLLMGACLNQRPELFGGCVAEVPFVDVTTTMLNPNLPLTVIEYEEWGNPNIREEYEIMYAYDPYAQYNGQPYPPMLITGGLNDPRVGYWEPTKWIAKIRTLHPNSSSILLKMNMTSGHSGSSGRLSMLEEDAWTSAFIVNCATSSKHSNHL